MAKKKVTTELKVRKKYEKASFMGINGKFEYSEPRMLGDMSQEELEEFYYSHNAATVKRYLVGQPAPKKEKKEDLPVKPEE